jgi:hypothetical protein
MVIERFIYITSFLIALPLWLLANDDIVYEGKSIILTYELSSQNIDFSKAIPFRNEDGQFEVRIKKEKFPIPAPHCKNNILLRMPSSSEKASDEIKMKQKIHSKVVELKSNPVQTLRVRIDLNPYVTVKQKNPFVGELQHCNVFFAPNLKAE